MIRLVDVDGVRLRTSIRGSGRPLLIITGLGASGGHLFLLERPAQLAAVVADHLTAEVGDDLAGTAARPEPNSHTDRIPRRR
jgi:hypothetical protein